MVCSSREEMKALRNESQRRARAIGTNCRSNLLIAQITSARATYITVFSYFGSLRQCVYLAHWCR